MAGSTCTSSSNFLLSVTRWTMQSRGGWSAAASWQSEANMTLPWTVRWMEIPGGALASL